MARQPRIEYEGAFYHVMARGDRREPIVEDDEDRRVFLAALGEAANRAGWRVHAWVLMTNHYHWLIETPRANLVDGMRWFQNTYTRRFNARHRRWGHLFGGRYKAVVLDPEDREGRYFMTLVDYIHLNPVRARIVAPEEGKGLLDYSWSSLSSAYAVAPSKRQEWMETEIGLNMRQCPDTVAGRRRFLKDLEQRINEETLEAGLSHPRAQSLQSTLRRGWYWGSEALKEKLMSINKGASTPHNRDYRLSQFGKDYAEAAAEAIVKMALEETGLSEADLKLLPGSDRRKVEIAALLQKETTVSQSWIAARLSMGSPGNVSQQLFRRRKTMVARK